MSMGSLNVVKVSLLLLKQIYVHTNYKNAHEAMLIFNEIEAKLPLIASQDKQGTEFRNRFSSFAGSISSKDSFKDMIKIIWRTVKSKSGQPQYKLCLFLVSMASLIISMNAQFNKDLDDWVQVIVQWLGNQLTIGGKGATGEGEGNVVDRMNRFFLTPYLHDFD